jgi:tellurite resistance protein
MTPTQGRTAVEAPPSTAGPRTKTGANLLSLFAIPLGVAGLGGVWQAMKLYLDAPAWPAEVLFGASTLLWAGITVIYIVNTLRRSVNFTADRQHAFYGPFAAYIPIIGILNAGHYVPYLHAIARLAVLAAVAALAVLIAQLLAHWLRGNLPANDFHPGYLLPTVAGGFIASIGLSVSGWHQAAQSAFGVGVFFWLTIGTLIVNRLFTGQPLPDATKPSMAVLVSPPATAAIAWLILNGGTMDTVAYLLLGVLTIMALIQILFFVEYRMLAFTLTFWAFTFPIAASTNVGIRWLTTIHEPFATALCWAAAALATTFIAILTAATVAHIIRKGPIG